MTLQYNYDKATGKWREYDPKLKKFGSDAPPALSAALSAQMPEAITVDNKPPTPGVKTLAQKAQKETHVNNVRVKPGNSKNPNPTIVTFQGKNYGYDVTFRGGGRWREVGNDGFFGKTARSDINHRLSQMYFPQFNLMPGSPLQVPKQPRRVIQGLPMFQKSKGGSLPTKDIKGKLNITGGSEGSEEPAAVYKRPPVIMPPPAKETPGRLNIRAPGPTEFPIPQGPGDNGTDPNYKPGPAPTGPQNTPSPAAQQKVAATRKSFGVGSILNLFRGRKNPGNGGINGGPTAPTSVNGGSPRSPVRRQPSAGGRVGGSEVLSRIATNTEYTNVVLTAILRYFRKGDTEKSIDHEFKRAREIQGKKPSLLQRLKKGKSGGGGGGSGGGSDLLASGLGTLLGAGAIAALVWEMLPQEKRDAIVNKIKDEFGSILIKGVEMAVSTVKDVASAAWEGYKKWLNDQWKLPGQADADKAQKAKQDQDQKLHDKVFQKIDENKREGETGRETAKRIGIDIPDDMKGKQKIIGQSKEPGGNPIRETGAFLGSAVDWATGTASGPDSHASRWRAGGAKADDFLNTDGIDVGKSASRLVHSSPKEKTYSPTVKSDDSGKVDPDDMLRYLKSKGYSDKISRAIMGNFSAESGLNASKSNPDDKGMESFGLAQWRGPRLEALKKYATSKGEDYKDPKTQMDYMATEHEFRKTLQEMRRWESGGSGQDDLTGLFRKGFEKPAKDKSGNLLGLSGAQSFARNLGPTTRSEGSAIEDKNSQVANADSPTIVAPQTTNITNNYINKNGGGQIAPATNDDTSWRNSQVIR